MKRFQEWYAPRKQKGERMGEWKGVLRRAMERRGRPCKKIHPQAPEGKKIEVFAYAGVSWREG